VQQSNFLVLLVVQVHHEAGSPDYVLATKVNSLPLFSATFDGYPVGLNDQSIAHVNTRVPDVDSMCECYQLLDSDNL